FVPSYNHAPFVEKCLKSIIKQTLSPKKLLVIDDGSKDDSPRIIERVLKDCPFDAELIVRENCGLCATLNEGFARSSGEYFAYLGSDDLWLPAFLAERAELLEKRESAVLAYGHSFTIDAEENIIDCSADWANFPDGDPRPMLFRGNAPFSPTVVYRRSALENTVWNEKAKLEDYDFYLRLAEKGEFAFDRQVLSAWRQHGANASDDWQFMLDEVLAAQNRNAAELGINLKTLVRIQTETKFSYTENLARSGKKMRAFSLFFNNLRGADSTRLAAKNLLRILTPMPILRRYRQTAQRRTTHKYGKVEI
ncbi:MAG: glycosyltransferase family A protein, partial [Acidobacteriota bacterium]